jgi:hypothetical protein
MIRELQLGITDGRRKPKKNQSNTTLILYRVAQKERMFFKYYYPFKKHAFFFYYPIKKHAFFLRHPVLNLRLPN